MKYDRKDAYMNERMPLVAGTEIEYRGQMATVVKDDGGDTLVVDCENTTQKWSWYLDGYECTVVDRK